MILKKLVLFCLVNGIYAVPFKEKAEEAFPLLYRKNRLFSDSCSAPRLRHPYKSSHDNIRYFNNVVAHQLEIYNHIVNIFLT